MFEKIKNSFSSNSYYRIRRVTSRLLVTLLGSLCFNATAQNTELQSLSLYLPVSSQDHPNLQKTLNESLQRNQFSNIEVKFSEHWHSYQQGLKNGDIGLYLAPPHFAAWAINRNNFIPLIRIAEPLSFVIAAKRSQPEIFELYDLINRPVCSERPLNLDYLLSFEAFNNLYGSSENNFVSNVKAEMLAKQTDCYGFAISNHVLRQSQIEGNDDFIRLYQGQSYNNYVLIAHPQISTEFLQRLKRYFIQADTQQLLRPLLKLYANEIKLISSKKADYPVSYIDVLKVHWQ